MYKREEKTMGYKIHFDHGIVDAEELRLMETKKAILEKLRVRFGFEYASPRHTASATQAGTIRRSPLSFSSPRR
jgi:hypothetical protein